MLLLMMVELILFQDLCGLCLKKVQCSSYLNIIFHPSSLWPSWNNFLFPYFLFSLVLFFRLFCLLFYLCNFHLCLSHPVSLCLSVSSVPINIISFTISPYNCLLDDTEILLQCVVEGLPEPEVTYRRNNIPFTCDSMSCDISAEVNEFVTTSNLTFHDPMRSDEGISSICLFVFLFIIYWWETF